MRGSLGYLDTKETLKEMSAKTPQQHHLLIFVQCVVHKLAAQTNGAGRIVFLDFFIFFWRSCESGESVTAGCICSQSIFRVARLTAKQKTTVCLCHNGKRS